MFSSLSEVLYAIFRWRRLILTWLQTLRRVVSTDCVGNTNSNYQGYWRTEVLSLVALENIILSICIKMVSFEGTNIYNLFKNFYRYTIALLPNNNTKRDNSFRSLKILQ